MNFSLFFSFVCIVINFSLDFIRIVPYSVLMCVFLQSPSLNVTWSSGTKISCSAVKNSTTPWWTVTGSPWILSAPPSPPSLDNYSSYPSFTLNHLLPLYSAVAWPHSDTLKSGSSASDALWPPRKPEIHKNTIVLKNERSVCALQPESSERH